MKIIRAKDDKLDLWELQEWIANHPDAYKERIGISWKVGKRRKLRSYHISWETWECDCCGRITSVRFEKGGKQFTLDNHFGPGILYITSL